MPPGNVAASCLCRRTGTEKKKLGEKKMGGMKLQIKLENGYNLCPFFSKSWLIN